VIPDLFCGLCDDAALFPPGNAALGDAVQAHAAFADAPYADMVGPFVVSANSLHSLADHTRACRELVQIAVTASVPAIQRTLADVDGMTGVRLAALEIALGQEMAAGQVVPTIRNALAGREVTVYVEVPREGRRKAVVRELAAGGLRAKLRTGGITADLYPDERELAGSLVALASAGVPFKATAGLHHAVRNTDPQTRFEQHGFLNLLVAAQAASEGAPVDTVAHILAERDPAIVVAQVAELDAEVRTAFRSFGTCSVNEPLDELIELGLLSSDLRAPAP
jgi:hypothetical protein